MAKKLGTKGYAKMRKTELINVLGSTQASEANIPIPGPVRPTIVKPSRASNKRVIDLARNEIKKFTDWILSYIPDSTKRVVSKRLRDLQKKVASIAEEEPPPQPPPDYFIPERHQTALKGFLKTYIIKGRSGYDPASFLKKARSQFYVLMRKQRKPLKSKCILTCAFHKEG